MNEQHYRRKTIGVVGSSTITEEVAAAAREVGALICRKGANLLCGGLGGVMQEACRGFADERFRLGGKGYGVTVGLIPGVDSRDANPFVDLVIPTGMGMMRNFLVVQASDLLVSIAGGSGTLSELAIAWQKGKTIIALKPTGGWSMELAGRRIDGKRPDTVVEAAAVEDVEKGIDTILGTP
jgi:uncharacterized protein (TIGR00725 family)